MTERASELLSELADRLSADSRDSGQVVAESVRTLEPELLRMQKDGASIDDLVRTSVGFLEILFRSLRADSRVPWQQYYTLAREASRRYAEIGMTDSSCFQTIRFGVAKRSATACSASSAIRVPMRSASRSSSVNATFGSTFPPAPWK